MTAPKRSDESWSERAYRALVVLLYPPEFRLEYGAQVEQAFRDRVAEVVREQGWRGLLGFWYRTLGDLLTSGVRLRFRALLPGGGAGNGHGREPLGSTIRGKRKGTGGFMLEVLIQDIRYALRSFGKAPGFTAVTILTLALGIGANTAIFSVVNAVILRPLPYGTPEELVLVWNRPTVGDAVRGGMSGPDLYDLNEQASLFRGFVGAWAIGTNLTGEGAPEQVTLSWVSTDFFSLLEVDASIGRTFVREDKSNTDIEVITSEDFTPPPAPLVITHGLWQRRFGGDSVMTGKVIDVNSQRMSVIGVLPEDFRLYLPADASIPTDIDAFTLFPIDMTKMPRASALLTVIGRLRPDVTIDQGQEELTAVAARWREDHTVHSQLATAIEVAPMHREVVGHVRSVLWVLLGAVGFVLLIACANVANLLLVRASARERELAIRAALGGGTSRIIRQLLTESLLLAFFGAAAGLLLASWGIELLLALRPDNLPRVERIGMDGAVLLFTLLASVLAAAVFGAIPALYAMRSNLTDTLKERGASASGPVRQRTRRGLVVTEVALSLVLLIGAGLLLKSFTLLSAVQPGFESTNVLTTNVSLPFFTYRDWQRRADFYQSLIDGLGELPGVVAVGGVSSLPLSGADSETHSYALNESDPAEWAANEADFRTVIPGYFEAMQTELLSGRTFLRADNMLGARRVAVLDEILARKLWPNESPIGKQFFTAVGDSTQTGGVVARVEVVGVVEHVRHADLSNDGRGTIYLPYRSDAGFEMSVVARTTDDPLGLVGQVRQRVMALDPDLPIFAVRTMEDYVADALAPTRFALVLIGVFAGVALALAAIGLYGVISYLVRQRTREIGVRMAFGAGRSRIIRLVVGEGLGLAVVGVVAGLGAALLLTQLIGSMLFGVGAKDPTTFVGISVLLLAVTAAASYVPARRATRVDPTIALRSE